MFPNMGNSMDGSLGWQTADTGIRLRTLGIPMFLEQGAVPTGYSVVWNATKHHAGRNCALRSSTALTIITRTPPVVYSEELESLIFFEPLVTPHSTTRRMDPPNTYTKSDTEERVLSMSTKMLRTLPHLHINVGCDGAAEITPRFP
jgi:hypothetical protein